MISFYSPIEVQTGAVIQFDDNNAVYKITMCIDLSYFGGKGYQINLEQV